MIGRPGRARRSAPQPVQTVALQLAVRIAHSRRRGRLRIRCRTGRRAGCRPGRGAGHGGRASDPGHPARRARQGPLRGSPARHTIVCFSIHSWLGSAAPGERLWPCRVPPQLFYAHDNHLVPLPRDRDRQAKSPARRGPAASRVCNCVYTTTPKSRIGAAQAQVRLTTGSRSFRTSARRPHCSITASCCSRRPRQDMPAWLYSCAALSTCKASKTQASRSKYGAKPRRRPTPSRAFRPRSTDARFGPVGLYGAFGRQ